MFLQPASSWQAHVNFVHPAAPTIGRVLAFLPSVGAKAVVVFEAARARGAWWANMARLGGAGVLSVRRLHGFLVVAVDHSRPRLLSPFALTCIGVVLGEP